MSVTPALPRLDTAAPVSHGARRVRDWSAHAYGPVGVDGPVGSWARACAALLDASAHPGTLPTPPDHGPAERAATLETLTRIYAEAEIVEAGLAPVWWPGGAADAVAATAAPAQPAA